jgi:hypothetical protein
MIRFMPYSVMPVIVTLLFSCCLLVPARSATAQSPSTRTQYLIPVVTDTSLFYADFLTHLRAETGPVINRFTPPISVFLDPQYQSVNAGLHTEYTAAITTWNSVIPDLFQIESDSSQSAILLLYQDGAFGEVQVEHDSTSAPGRARVYHGNTDVNFSKLLFRSLGLDLSLDLQDIGEDGEVSGVQQAILSAYFNMPNGTNLMAYSSAAADTSLPTAALTAPDSSYIFRHTDLSATGSQDDQGIQTYYWQFKTPYHPSVGFAPDTMTTVPSLTVAFPDSGNKIVAVAVGDASKNYALAVKFGCRYRVGGHRAGSGRNAACTRHGQ